MIHVVLDRVHTGAKEILYCRFTEEDILHNKVENIIKIRVNPQQEPALSSTAIQDRARRVTKNKKRIHTKTRI